MSDAMSIHVAGERIRWVARIVVLLTLPSLAVRSRPCEAGPLLELSGSPTARHAFAARIVPSGLSATYFNPSLLLFEPQAVQLGFVLLSQDLEYTVDARPAGVDVSDTIYNARLLNPDGTTSRLVYRPLPTALLPSGRGSHDPGQISLYGEFGVNTHLIDDRLVLGTYTLLPADIFQGQDPFYVDEREQYFTNSLFFELYEDRTRITIMGAALAGRPVEWLNLGLGLMLNTTSQAITDIFVIDPSNQGVADINGHVEITTSLVPHAGITVEPWSTLRLTATIHLPQGNDVTGKGDLVFWDYDYPEGQHSVEQPFRFTHAYNPLRLSLGASYTGGHADGIDLGNRQEKSGYHDRGPRWLVAASAAWSRWSEYRDRHQERPSSPWSDTVSAVIAGELSFSGHRVGLDLTWVPTPVPDQTGRSNYLDNTRLGGAVGWDWHFSVGSRRFYVSAQVQVQRLLHRRAVKSLTADDPVFDEYPDSVDIRTNEVIEDSIGFQTNNPGYPGYASEGWLASGGVSFNYLF